ncbi:hypothetical protein [Staphylococcus coagulans]|nr:hypothetical protein [Staphylococcus coagulans]MBA8764186.1 hypothetical protein [Staphylococcus coagulans]MBT2810394.1 hypothetical protein [Staphylococcus coagulans]MBT2821914.1 hypothetical protein [Staphylococcus coagulans]MBT2826037.1 hypothetical protein [Staphylococcus coagulans]MBT2828173.1 hypothetical protein [Staphylococcus coagulans]
MKIKNILLLLLLSYFLLTTFEFRTALGLYMMSIIVLISLENIQLLKTEE